MVWIRKLDFAGSLPGSPDPDVLDGVGVQRERVLESSDVMEAALDHASGGPHLPGDAGVSGYFRVHWSIN